jgi:ABC-2 type transport system ATP-binding protein
MADPVLVARNVTAGYGGRPVIAGIDLVVGLGDVLGLLGANGSGKSTLVRAITGQIRLTAGSVAIAGADLARAPELAKAGFGLAIDAPDLPDALSGQQYLDLVAAVRGVPADERSSGGVADRLMLTPWLDQPIAEYSLGTRAKVSIAAAVLGAPPLLIFDESLNGLDPVAAFEFKQLVAELAATGRHGIIVATHVVEAVPGFCNRAVLLADGRIADAFDAQRLEEARRSPGRFEADVIQTLKARQRQVAMAG